MMVITDDLTRILREQAEQTRVSSAARILQSTLEISLRHAMMHLTPEWNTSLAEVAAKTARETMFRILETVSLDQWESMIAARSKYHEHRGTLSTPMKTALDGVDALAMSDEHYRRFQNLPPP